MKSVKSQAVQSLTGQKTSDQIKAEREKKDKEAAAQAEKELGILLRGTIRQPKIDADTDPKSVLCEYFKQNCCEKGDKCKFSHDPLVGRKGAKIRRVVSLQLGVAGSAVFDKPSLPAAAYTPIAVTTTKLRTR
jgi:hypothetical protein